MVDSADTYASAAIAPGAAIPAAGGTAVGPDIQIVTDADHPDRQGPAGGVVGAVVGGQCGFRLLFRSSLNPLNIKEWESYCC
jgi:hypothetical protein